MKRIAIASLAAGLLALAGCIHVHEHEYEHEARNEGGPPPWAPAHGYRHKQPGPELVFDPQIGVYVVVGFPDVYFYDDHYFRVVSSRWERCRDWEKARWKTVDVAVVPVPVVQYYTEKHGKGKGHGKGHGHGHGAAKHDED